MNLLKIAALIIIIVYLAIQIILYVLQTRLIFYPGKLSPAFKFKLRPGDEEVFLETKDSEKINAIFYKGNKAEVILYFHGNAGDLSGWQFAAEDFSLLEYYVLIVDYRGYGKSSGTISENGFYADAEAAYNFLTGEKDFAPENIIVYGRSIGSGVAVEIASKFPCKGLVLESPYSSLKKLADEKLPFFFPSLYLKYSFDNFKKINEVKCPIIFLHGVKDTLIPVSHAKKLCEKFKGRKKLVLVAEGSHNDLNSFDEHSVFLHEVLPMFFDISQTKVN